jgi:hypothetical protein
MPPGLGRFIKDGGLSEKEVAGQESVSKPISMRYRILASIALIFTSFVVGILVPWGFFGGKSHRGAFEEVWPAEGGLELWLSWSIYELTGAAAFLAVGYCILAEYIRWFLDSRNDESRR